jgi:tetrathionate reductase subunit C
LSAGSFVVSVIATIGGKTEYKPLGKIGAVLAPILLILAPLNLIVDLEMPLRFWHLFVYLNFTSPITYGTFLLTIYPISGLIYAWFVFKGNQKMASFFGIIGIPLAICTHGYTGFILALGKGRALWSTALMPSLFIVSAMVSGIALLILAASIRNRFFLKNTEEKERDKELIIGLGKLMGGIIMMDIFMVFNAILVLLTSTKEAYEVVKLMLVGSFSYEFLGIEIFLGGIIPLFLVFNKKTRKSLIWLIIASILTLIGVYSMRIVVVIAGQSIPLH